MLPAQVIVRVFGTETGMFSQQDERDIFLLASRLRLGPQCLVRGLPACGWPGSVLAGCRVGRGSGSVA